MKRSYLPITDLKGRPLAAYYCLLRQDEDRSARTEQAEDGLLVDYSSDGRPIGVEITSPTQFNLATLNDVLSRLGQETVPKEDVAPLIDS